jgi:hypothetical protein
MELFRRAADPRFQIHDILAVMVGYGMAALLFRAFWPERQPTVVMLVAACGLYLWFGLAMSGPLLLVRRRSTPADLTAGPGRESPVDGSRTWAELSWCLIGSYWVILGLVAIPVRLHEFQSGDVVCLGLVPVAVALVQKMFGSDPRPDRRSNHAWTHGAAVLVVGSWPIAWVCLILLGRTLH